MQDAIKELIQACKGRQDLLSFVGIGILAAAVAIATKSVPLTITFVIVMGALWIGSRYALYRLQSQEKLRDLRHRSLADSQRVLTEHVSDDEFDLVVLSKNKKEDDNER